MVPPRGGTGPCLRTRRKVARSPRAPRSNREALPRLMRVRWTTDAADDLERISDYIAQERPQAAQRIALDIIQRVDALETFSSRGRPGRVEGTRELALAPLPFIAVYEVYEQEVQVLR